MAIWAESLVIWAITLIIFISRTLLFAENNETYKFGLNKKNTFENKL